MTNLKWKESWSPTKNFMAIILKSLHTIDTSGGSLAKIAEILTNFKRFQKVTIKLNFIFNFIEKGNLVLACWPVFHNFIAYPLFLDHKTKFFRCFPTSFFSEKLVKDFPVKTFTVNSSLSNDKIWKSGKIWDTHH